MRDNAQEAAVAAEHVLLLCEVRPPNVQLLLFTVLSFHVVFGAERERRQ